MKRMTPGLLIAACCLLLVPQVLLAGYGKRQAADPLLAAQNGGQKQVHPDDIKASNDFVSSHFLGSSYCVRCHDNIPGEDTTVSLVEDWRVSMMAFSFVDPLWQAKVRSETLRVPQYQAIIEKKCARCHAPMAVVEAETDGATVSLFEDGFTDRNNPYHDLAKEGVSCTLCHQIMADNLGSEESFSGGFQIGEESGSQRPLYAQVPDPFTSSMQRAVKYRPAYGPHMHSSEVCATCHELLTPYIVQATGNWAVGSFPEQTPYGEWLESVYSDELSGRVMACHDCHLTHEPYVPAAKAPRWLQPLTDFSRHTYYSENLSMLQILENFARELRIDASGLAEAAAESADYLAGAGTVEMLYEFDGDVLELKVRVHNHAGHKLPTSIPLRRVYLHVLITGPDGEPVFESGRVQADGSIVGVDADTDPSSFEPHYSGAITSADQVQVYEGIMGDTDGKLTYTLLHAGQFLKDNRLLPDGFDKDLAAERVKVYGAAAADDDFDGGGDTVTYRIGGLGGDSYNVLVELRDQTMAYPFLIDLFRDNDDPVVADFERMYLDSAVTKEPEVIDAEAMTVTRR